MEDVLKSLMAVTVGPCGGYPSAAGRLGRLVRVARPTVLEGGGGDRAGVVGSVFENVGTLLPVMENWGE